MWYENLKPRVINISERILSSIVQPVCKKIKERPLKWVDNPLPSSSAGRFLHLLSMCWVPPTSRG